jgi:hypothetical protein
LREDYRSWLEPARTEQRGRATERAITHALKLAYLGTAVDDQQLLAERLVERIAEMFQADRVSIALFSAADQTLKIVASAGVPLEISKRARIKPGDWALGHVFTSSSVLTVLDVRLLPSRNPIARATRHTPSLPRRWSLATKLSGRCRSPIDATAARSPAVTVCRYAFIGAAAGAALSAAAARESIERLQHQRPQTR